MQSKAPFLFSMPPLFAWPLAIGTSTFLILGVFLVFVEASPEGEDPTEPPAEVAQSPEAEAAEAETPAPTQRLTSTGQVVLIGLLVVSVGLIPMMARRKRMKAMWWSIAGVGTGFMHLLLGGLPLIHPLMVLLALVYMRPQPLTAPAAPPDMRSSEAREAGSVDTPARVESAQPARRRPPRRRRRPRF